MTSSRTRDPGYRPDLEGLRGVAILLVLLCHVRIPGAEAGFVGVDVFFVLSGFLITGLLVNERERTGRIGLGPFYARRARRILPAAVLVLATTLLAAPLVLSPLDLRRIADDGLAASLSLANMRYRRRRHRLLRARRCLADAPFLVAGRRGAVLPPVADPAADGRAHRASATRDGRPRDRGPRRLVRAVPSC